jgi:hypothetical protein
MSLSRNSVSWHERDRREIETYIGYNRLLLHSRYLFLSQIRSYFILTNHILRNLPVQFVGNQASSVNSISYQHSFSLLSTPTTPIINLRLLSLVSTLIAIRHISLGIRALGSVQVFKLKSCVKFKVVPAVTYYSQENQYRIFS